MVTAQALDLTSGWPAFAKPVAADHVVLRADGETALEVLCARTGAHLGHRVSDAYVRCADVPPMEPRRRRGCGVDVPWRRVATFAARTFRRWNRGDAAAATWTFRGDVRRADVPSMESRRRRGCDVDIPWRRVAATPRLLRGNSVETGARLRYYCVNAVALVVLQPGASPPPGSLPVAAATATPPPALVAILGEDAWPAE